MQEGHKTVYFSCKSRSLARRKVQGVAVAAEHGLRNTYDNTSLRLVLSRWEGRSK